MKVISKNTIFSASAAMLLSLSVAWSQPGNQPDGQSAPPPPPAQGESSANGSEAGNPPAQPPAPTQPPATDAQQPPADPEDDKVVCKKVEKASGSRIGTKTVCMTVKEWRGYKEDQ